MQAIQTQFRVALCEQFIRLLGSTFKYCLCVVKIQKNQPSVVTLEIDRIKK